MSGVVLEHQNKKLKLRITNQRDGEAEVRTRDLSHAKRTRYHCATTPSLLLHGRSFPAVHDVAYCMLGTPIYSMRQTHGCRAQTTAVITCARPLRAHPWDAWVRPRCWSSRLGSSLAS